MNDVILRTPQKVRVVTMMMQTFRKTLKSTVAPLAAFGVLSMTAAGGAQGESLSEALSMAYTTNPSLQSARANLRATDEGVSQALSGYRPSVSATGSASRKETETSADPGNTIDTDPRSLALSVNQSLYAGGQTMADVSSAEHNVRAQRAGLRGTEQTVLLNAATAYLDVLRDQAVLELNRNNEDVLSRHLEATQDRFDVGEITRTDVHQAEARLAGATAQRIQAEGNLEASRATYANVVGQAPGILEAPSLPVTIPETLGQALDFAADNNPNVVAAVFGEKAAQSAIDSARGQLLPSVDLSGSASRALDSSGRDTWSNALEAKVTVSVPLYQSGAVYSQVRQARQQASAARLDVDQARRDVAEQVRQAWQNLDATQARIESIETQVRAAETALEGVQREASVGSRTVLDVLDAEQELLDARVNLVTSQRDETVAKLTLLSAIGRLSAADLNLGVDLYDAGGHYRSVRDKWFGTE